MRLGTFDDLVEGAKRSTIGGIDAATTIGKNITWLPVTGYAGLVKALHAAAKGKSRDEAISSGVEGVEDTQKLAAPFTQAGGDYVGKVGEGIEKVMEPVQRAQDALGEASPAGGAAMAAGLAVLDPTKLGKLKRVKGAAKAAEGAGKATKAAEGAAESAARSSAGKAPGESLRADIEAATAQAEEQAKRDYALRGFGESKAKREASAEKRTKAQAGKTFEKQKGAGERGATEPDFYRQMYQEQGQDAVIEAAKRSEHLKPNPEGGYVGAPRNVQTGPQLGHMRKQFDDQVNRAIDAVTYADPGREGTWYNRAQAAQAEMAEPHQLARGLEETAGYSAGVAPDSELAFRIKHNNSARIGDPEYAYRTRAADDLDEAVAAGMPADLGAKIDEYGQKNDPRLPLKGPFGVNDFRMAQAFGYTDPSGKMATKVSAQMHPVMDAETALAVDRANTRGGAGSDLTGAQLQEYPWVLGKAEDIYNRGKNARFKGGQEGMVKALREANKTIGDFFPKHTFTLTHEPIPGASTGHVPSILDAPFAEKQGYGRTGSWSTPAPMKGWKPGEGKLPWDDSYMFHDPRDLGMPENVGAGNRDALGRAQGYYQRPDVEATGQFTNSLGGVEQNPVTLSRPLVDFEKLTKGANANTVDPKTMKALRAQEMFRGAMDVQESVGGNIPGTMNARKGKTSMLLERGTPPSAEELANVQSLLEGTEGVYAAPTDRGLHVMNTTDDPKKAKYFSEYMRKMKPQMEDAYPGSKATPSASQSLYEPVFTDWDENPTPYGKGVVTTKVLDAMKDAPPDVARNISESEEVRRIIGDKGLRDSLRGGTRDDVQKMRQFFTNADWAKVVDLMRQGMKPAAAVGALGYSLEGMAAERPDVPR